MVAGVVALRGVVTADALAALVADVAEGRDEARGGVAISAKPPKGPCKLIVPAVFLWNVMTTCPSVYSGPISIGRPSSRVTTT